MPLITVQVTSDDIEKGQRRNDWSCPICLALFRATGTKWVVNPENCYPITDRDCFIPLPEEVQDFIRDFDAQGFGEPFSFEIDAPEKAA